jgi:hypothetical protein
LNRHIIIIIATTTTTLHGLSKNQFRSHIWFHLF